MTRSSSSALGMRSRVLAAGLVLLAVALAPPAHAGLGDLVKKAKDKAAQVAGQKAGQKAAETAGVTDDGAGGKVEFNDTVLELTSDRIEHFLTGMKVAGNGRPERAALVAKKDKLIDQRSALLDKHSKEIDAAREKHETAQRCWDDALSETQDARNEAMREKMMSDPDARGKMVAMAQRMSEAQAKGDTATASRLQREMAGMTAPTHADSLAAQQKCGPIPPPHPAGAQAEALQRQAAALDEQVREMDRQAAAERSKASGMNEAQFAMVLERVQMYLDALKGKSKPRGFTSDELAALDAHRDALKAAVD